MSNYVVIARFDEKKDNQINALRKTLSDQGFYITKWPPHVTIAAYENIDETLLCNWTANFTSTHTKQKIALNSLSILPPGSEFSDTAVICLNPAHSKTFVDFYYAFHQKYEEFCTGIGWHNSITHDNPVIHATIATVNVTELQKVLDIIFSQNIFGGAELTALEVYTYPMKLIKRFELQ